MKNIKIAFFGLLLTSLCSLNSVLAQTKKSNKTAVTAVNAPTLFITVSDVKYAYRRFGNNKNIPLVFFQHFTGTLDNWDPAVLDGLSKDREIIIFDNAGVSSSTGEVASNIEGIAATAINFIDALKLKKIDLFGFSMGGFVAQQVALTRPDLIHKIILAGTGPKGGEGLESFSPEVWAMLKKTYTPADALLLDTFFSPTSSSQKAGQAFLERLHLRKTERDIPINDKVIPAQLSAIAGWGKKGTGNYDYLKNITCPVLVVNGNNDLLFFTINSYHLQQNLPNARLILYPNSNHGAIYQFPDEFVKQALLFLNDTTIK